MYNGDSSEILIKIHTDLKKKRNKEIFKVDNLNSITTEKSVFSPIHKGKNT